jgi:glycosyltransferase involved in cell wall biosynthesis
MNFGGIGRHYTRKARRRADRARNERRWAAAAAGYRRWLGLRPDDGPIWVQLGHVLREGGDVAAAREAYRRAADLMPDDADLLLFRGHLERQVGDDGSALDLYRRSHAQDGNAAAARAIDLMTPPQKESGAEVEDDTADEDGPDDDHPGEDAVGGSESDGGNGGDADDAAAAEAATSPIGAVEYLNHEVVHGWLSPGQDGDGIVFTADGEVVGRAWPDRDQRRGDGYEFRTLLAIDGAMEVHARRSSDDAELQGSPFVTQPVATVETQRRRPQDARVAVVKPVAIPAGAEVALFVTHSGTGALKPHVFRYLAALHGQDIATILIAVADRPLDLAPDVLDRCAGVVVRENLGYDFGAWAHAIALYPEVYGAPVLYLVNDSVIGPATDEKFERVVARVRASGADVVGLTESHEYRWHLQSYFLALKARALATFELQTFFARIDVAEDKDEVIRRFELPLAAKLEDAGCTTEVLFPGYSALNPVLRAWRALLRDDFPFMKLLPLRGAFPELDLTGWREALAAAGFDLTLVDAVLRASEEFIPRDADDRLYAHPLRPMPPEQPAAPLKVAFYGPWNYDNGLGAASRGIIGALRRSGFRLNLHPIKKPFHIHRRLVPAVDVRDFGGEADIAIVHLNPDSWHLLTDDQRAEIRSARRRIGYWVWEMGHLPDAWWHEFNSVDRIWAPSRYCAALFDAQDGAPVDVIPHPVPVPASPPPTAEDRDAMRRSLGLPADSRVILFVFDGSSYLVRKNPAALVRGFAASGLAERGWHLVLKTKHLMDRSAEGAALQEMVAGERNVLLVERNLSAAELTRMLACADIYASPHSSEGFGLTVAEAMAAGRPVVATDFGGSTDFLDAGTGYPVRAHPWRLPEDFGHYTRGGEWARIDEPALSFALAQAALAVERGDGEIGAAARARVADYLSIDSVSAAIDRSIADMMIDRPRCEAPRPERLNLRAGVPLDRGTGDERVAIVQLRADGSFDGDERIEAGGTEWVVLAPRGSVLSPLFASTLLTHAALRPDAGLFYADDIAGEVERAVDQFRLKPEFDQTLLCAQDYVGAPLAVRSAVLDALGGLDPAAGTAAVADLLFRAHGAGHVIARIPDVLLAHPGRRVVATPADYAAMLRAQPLLRDYAIAPGLTPETVAIDRLYAAGGEPPVTLIIPTCRGCAQGAERPGIEQLLDNLHHVDWPMDKLTVIVGDDIAGEAAWAQAERPYRLRRIETPRPAGEPFNYAAKMNRLWREATTEQIVFLNDDLQPLEPGWLRALQTFALDAGVGGVGARLLFSDGSLQHAGFLPHGAAAAHAWVYRRRRRGTFHDWALVHREWSMVTGAVFATRRSVMEEVGGFDEVFSVEFNDTDLCLRLRALGYRIVYTPHAEMIHVEKVSRGEAPPRGDTTARFLGRWLAWLDQDPSGHPQLRRDRVEVRPVITRRQWYF